MATEEQDMQAVSDLRKCAGLLSTFLKGICQQLEIDEDTSMKIKLGDTELVQTTIAELFADTTAALEATKHLSA